MPSTLVKIFKGAALVMLSLWTRHALALPLSAPTAPLKNFHSRQIGTIGRISSLRRQSRTVLPYSSRSLPYLNPILARHNGSPALAGGTEIFAYGVPKGGASFVSLIVDLGDLSESQKACEYWVVSGEQGCGDDGFIGGPSANRGLTGYTIEGTRDGKTWELAPPAKVPAELRFVGNTVSGNTRRATCHALDVRGFAKARIKITAGRGWQNGQCGLNLNIYDASSCRTLADWSALDGVTVLGDSTCEIPSAFVPNFSAQIAAKDHPHPPVYWFGQPYATTGHFVKDAAWYEEVLREKQGRFVVLLTGANDVSFTDWLSSVDTLIKRNRASGKVTMVCLPLYPNGPAAPDGGAPSRVRQGLDALYEGKPLAQHLRAVYAGQTDVIISDALSRWSRDNPGVMRPNDLHQADLPGWRATLAAEIKAQFFGLPALSALTPGLPGA